MDVSFLIQPNIAGALEHDFLSIQFGMYVLFFHFMIPTGELIFFRVKAMAISYNWLFRWDKKHSINGVLLVFITGISGQNSAEG